MDVVRSAVGSARTVLNTTLGLSSPSAASPRGPAAQSFESVDYSGWLTKLGGKGFQRNWRRRWFVLTGEYIYYYKSEVDADPAGIIYLGNFDTIVQDPDNKRSRFCWKLFSSQQSYEAAPSRVYFAHAETDSEMRGWIDAIKAKMSPLFRDQGPNSPLVTIARPKGANGRRLPTKKPTVHTFDESEDDDDDGYPDSPAGAPSPSENSLSSKKSATSLNSSFRQAESFSDKDSNNNNSLQRPPKPGRALPAPIPGMETPSSAGSRMDSPYTPSEPPDGYNSTSKPSPVPANGSPFPTAPPRATALSNAGNSASAAGSREGSQRTGPKVMPNAVALPGMSAGPFISSGGSQKVIVTAPSHPPGMPFKPRSASENALVEELSHRRKDSLENPPSTLPKPQFRPGTPTSQSPARSQSPKPMASGSPMSLSTPSLVQAIPPPIAFLPSTIPPPLASVESGSSGYVAGSEAASQILTTSRRGTETDGSVAARKAELEAERSKRARLEKELEASRAELDVARGQLRETERDRSNSTRSQRGDRADSPERYDGMALVLHDEIMKLKKELERSQSDNKRLESELRTERDRSGQAVRIALDEQYELQEKLTQAEQDLSAAKLARLDSQDGSAWKEEVERLQDQLARFSEDNADMRERLRNREQELEAAMIANAGLQAELSKAQNSTKSAAASGTDAAGDANTKEAIAMLKKENDRLRTREREVIDALRVARSGLHAAKAEIASARKKAAYFELKASAQEMELMILQAKVEKGGPATSAKGDKFANGAPEPKQSSMVKTIEELMAQYAIQSEVEQVLENARHSIALVLDD